MINEKDHCETYYVDTEKVNRARTEMVDENTAATLAETFSVLGDPTRVKILHTLLKEELCVCDLASLLGMTDSAISHQLRLLRSLKIVKFRREGKIVYYSLCDSHVEKLLEMGLAHARE